MATLGKPLKGHGAAPEAATVEAAKVATAAKNTLLKGKLAAAGESDNAHRLSEQMKKILVERFRAEDAISQAHRAQVESSWTRILRMAKTEALRNDVELLAAQHERDCIHRDATLKMLFDDLLAAEEQYRVALHSHLRQVNRLIELQDARITDLEAAFSAELAAVTASFREELDGIVSRHNVDRRELRVLIATVTEAEEAKAAEARQTHEASREEIRNKSIDRIQDLSRTLDDRIMELEAAFESAHVGYLHATDAKTEAFKALVGDSQKAERRIQRRAEAVDRAKAALGALKNKIAANAREYEEKNATLAMEKAEQAGFVAALKGQLDAFRGRSDARLQRLSAAVTTARSALESQLQLATRILLLAERCREFETAGERVVPVPMPDVAVGPTAGTVVTGPAASTRTAIGLLLSHPPGTAAAAGAEGGEGGQQQQEVGGEDGEAGRPPAASSPTLVAATVALTSGALVPVGLTAARHGLVPRADGLLGEAAAAAGAAMREARAKGGALLDDGGEGAGEGGSWDIVAPRAGGGGSRGGVATSSGGDAVVSASGSRAAAAGGWLGGGDTSDAALVASAAEQTAAARAAGGMDPGSRLLAEVADSSEMDALDLFWRRYNRALLDSLVLERQKAALAEENAGLQAALSAVLAGMSVSDSTLRAPQGNPLFIVNHRSGIVRPQMSAATAGGQLQQQQQRAGTRGPAAFVRPVGGQGNTVLVGPAGGGAGGAQA